MSGIFVRNNERYLAFTANAQVKVISSSNGVDWIEEFTALGSQASISGSSATVNLAYQNPEGALVYLEKSGAVWSSPRQVAVLGHSPFMAVNDIKDDGEVIGTARYVFYLHPDPPRTDFNEVFVAADQIFEDRIPPYVRILWPLGGIWTSAQTPVYWTSQEVPRLQPECRIDGQTWTACEANSEEGISLGELPGYNNLGDRALFTLQVRDTDAAGNTGTAEELLVKKDALAPDSSDNYGAKDGLWQGVAQTITIFPSDPGEAPEEGSGLDCSLYNYGTYCSSWTKYCLQQDCVLNQVNGSLYTEPLQFANEGITVLRYASRDIAGNIQTPVSRTVKIDLSNPTVTVGPDLISNSPVLIEADASDALSGIAAYSWEKVSGPGLVNFMPATSKDSIVSMSEDGYYRLVLTVTDQVGWSASDEMQVTWDTTAPVLTLMGEDEIEIEVHSLYQDAGASAVDNLDSAINSKIVVDGLVDSSTVGAYTVTFNVTDHAGNVAVPVQRMVHVVDTTKPVISLLGDDPVLVEKYAIYEDAGANARDNYDGDLSKAVVVHSNVNTRAVGEYSVKYSVTDGSGNSAIPVERAVRVISRGRVEGLQTPLAQIKLIKTRRGVVKFSNAQGKKIKARPFGASYRGKLWGREIDFGGSSGSVYLFVPQIGARRGGLVIFDRAGVRLKTSQVRCRKGCSAALVVETLNDAVYLALAQRSGAALVRLFEVTPGQLHNLGTVRAGIKSGNVSIVFRKYSDKQYALVTRVNRKNQRLFKYAPASNTFVPVE